MWKTGRNSQNTKECLLEAACHLFAEKGFSATTNRDICSRAGANIAAINYHFGSKEKLYAEAWRKAFHNSLEKHPPDGGVPPDAPAEERLHGRIQAMIHKFADKENPAFQIAHKEMAVPTSLLKEVKVECIGPLQEEMNNVLRELLGPEVPEQQVHFCQASIESQCFRILRHTRTSGSIQPETVSASSKDIEDDIAGYADHVFRFSLAGIKAVRSSIENDTDY